ncbi:MAG TPA: Uma2 family endonuclease [Thiothrix sp.]|nr:Uma2 family endonuclease [Thiothrix sp.]
MSLLQQKNTLSPEEYLAEEQQATLRHEYVAGTIYAMAGAGEQHNRIAGNVFFQLRAKARGSRCGVFMSDMKLRIDQGVCFYYPDVMLTCDTDDTEIHFKENPCLTAEVSSPLTESIDRREKLLAYKKIPSLNYYLIIAANRQHIDYYQRDTNQNWQLATLALNEVIHVQYGTGENAYEAGLCLEDIYEDVQWL